MNCWFCDAEIIRDSKEGFAYCNNKPCRYSYVQYTWTAYSNDLWRVGFKVYYTTSKNTSHEYFVSYDHNLKEMDVVERITPPFDPDDESVSIAYEWKEILTIPFNKGDSIILSPSNFKQRFPTLITFS